MTSFLITLLHALMKILLQITGALKGGKISEEGVKTISHVNNIPKLKERLSAIQKKVSQLV
jgi:hypothetical protein